MKKKEQFKTPPHIIELAKGLSELQDQAKALGLFTGDRDILKCENCGLLEDVTVEGKLMTYFGEDLDGDTGLRFKDTVNRNVFICPNCGEEVVQIEPEDIDFE